MWGYRSGGIRTEKKWPYGHRSHREAAHGRRSGKKEELWRNPESERRSFKLKK